MKARGLLRDFVLALSLSLGAIPCSDAESYPTKPIRIVVPLSAGVGWDVRVRQIAESVAKSMGIPIVVENRPGAGTTIGATAVAQSPPDGYTLLAATQADQSIAPAVYPSLRYDPAKDFTPITQILAGTPILLVNSEIPAKSFADLFSLAKKSPGQYTAASYGYGTYTHIIIAEMTRASGTDIVHIPYKKGSDALADVVGRRVSMLVDFYATSEPYIKSGKLRPILVASHKRHRALPTVATALELGIPRLSRRAWGGIVAPARTPKEIVDRLNAEFVKATRSAAMRKIIEEGGSDVVGSSAEDFGLFLRRDREEYSRLVREIGIKIE